MNLGDVIGGTHILLSCGEDLLKDIELLHGIDIYFTKKRECYVLDTLSYSGIKIDMNEGIIEPFVCGLYVKDYYESGERKVYRSKDTINSIYKDLIEREKINKDAFTEILGELVIIGKYVSL